MAERLLDIALTTSCSTGAYADCEVLFTEPIVWAGMKGGCAYMREPLPVSLWEEGCAWRAGALEALGREGRNYRVAYMSAHTAGQRAAILSDLAVAPLPKSFIGDDLVELGPKDGMPKMGDYSLAMVVAPDADAPVKAAADHIRAAFDAFRETGRF
jgi:DNA-binding transcriptional LysR family regulator